MSFFSLKNGVLHAENVALPVLAERFGTPAYVYSRAALTASLKEFQDVLGAHPTGAGALVCYAVKANSNLAVLNLFARLGAGFDIVSGGELQRVLAAGADPKKIVFSGVGKTAAEMRQALDAGIFCFNIESAPELERLNEVAGQCGKRAPISFRVNPNVDPKTHPYISTGLKEAKFGVAYEQALALYRRAAALPNIEVAGIDCHIGSQLLDPSPFVEALERILALVDQLTAEGIQLHHLDLGGGLGIKYQAAQVQPTVAAYLNPLLDKLAGRGLQIVLEPGRRLVGNAGLLLTRIEFLKEGEGKNFAIIDAAMNDLMRPALYEAWHDIDAVVPRAGATRDYDVVGPVCETGDFLGQARPLNVQPGDLLAVMSAGAYGMAMASNYNTRPRAVELMVDGDAVHVIRARETVAQLYAGEHPPAVSGVRVDKWLWAARFFKTRSLASDAVGGGKVKLNGAATKPARELKAGDRLEIQHGDTRWEVVVRALSEKRGPAPEARLLYEETAASVAAREAEQQRRKFTVEPAAELHGRPTKRDRRRLDRCGG